MSVAFWLSAALLTAIAAAFLVVPLWRNRRDSGRWSLSGLGAAAATIPVAVAIYLSVSTWEPGPTSRLSHDQADFLEQAAEHLKNNPDDVDGWMLLGRSYMVVGDYVRGRQAFTEAWNRTPAPDTGLMLALGESMILTSQNTGISNEAAGLIDSVLRAEPGNQKALWYSGIVAAERGQTDIACERWQTLLSSGPPAGVGEAIQSSLAQLGCASPGSLAAAGAAAPAAAAGPEIQLHVRLGAGHSIESFGPQAALFIFARAPGGGPPVAVIRQPVSALPGNFTLSDANTMIAGRSLDDFPQLSLVARISAAGQPTEQSGDLFAQTTFTHGDEPSVELVIDQVVP
jgi:cytochrome c-type biogenesis protein CcmH